MVDNKRMTRLRCRGDTVDLRLRRVGLAVALAHGAGKSTFAIEYADAMGLNYFGADSIAKELAPNNPFSVRVQASQQFLQRIRDALEKR